MLSYQLKGKCFAIVLAACSTLLAPIAVLAASASYGETVFTDDETSCVNQKGTVVGYTIGFNSSGDLDRLTVCKLPMAIRGPWVKFAVPAEGFRSTAEELKPSKLVQQRVRDLERSLGIPSGSRIVLLLAKSGFEPHVMTRLNGAGEPDPRGKFLFAHRPERFVVVREPSKDVVGKGSAHK